MLTPQGGPAVTIAVRGQPHHRSLLHSSQGHATDHSVQVNLYIFNFALDRTGHFKGMMFSQPLRCPQNNTGCTQVSQLDAWKEVYLMHRMTPNSVAWPAGLSACLTEIGPALLTARRRL